MPSYEFRTQTAKLFIELEQWDPASEILDLLLEEYDSNPEIWYLSGYAASFIDAESAQECLTKAREMLVKSNCTNPDIFEQVDTCLSKVNKILEQESNNSNSNPQDTAVSDTNKMDTE